MIIHFLGNETLLELTHIDVLLEGIQERITRLNNITSQVVIEELPEELVLSEHLAIISQKIAELQNDLRAVSIPLEKENLEARKKVQTELDK